MHLIEDSVQFAFHSGQPERRSSYVEGKKMKRAAGILFAVVLCLTGLLAAQDSGGTKQSSKAQQMTGTICNSSCLTQVENLQTCDPTCTIDTGDCVFVDNQGTVTKVENPQKCKGVMGKPVKIKVAPKETEKERQKDLVIEELEEMTP
jgi:hypothetical protein